MGSPAWLSEFIGALGLWLQDEQNLVNYLLIKTINTYYTD